MKKIFQKLSNSALKRNKAFSAGLFVLLALMAMVSSLSASFSKTVQGSVEDFMESADMPDGWITTEIVQEGDGEEIKNIPGVRSAQSSVVLPVKATLPSGDEMSLALFGAGEKEINRFYVKEETPDRTDLPEVWVTAYFAEKNGVRPGNELTLKASPFFEEKVRAKGLVSLPETMRCVRNETSWGDATSYGYIYMPREDMDGFFNKGGTANYWSIRLEDGLSSEERQEAMDRAGEVFGDRTLNVLLYDTSTAKSSIDDMMKTIRSICNSFPVIIYIVGLFFMILFVSQVIRNRSRDIGLLVALGHSRKEVVLIFFRYLVILLIPGVIVGSVLGFLVTVIISGLFVDMYTLPRVLYRFDATRYAVMILTEVVLCILSCILSTFLIITSDPAEAMSGGKAKVGQAPAVIRGLKIDPIIKAGLSSLFRDRRRTILSILAISACIFLSAGSLEYLIGFTDAIPRTFGKRYTYDALIHVENGREDLSAIENIRGVAKAEPVLSFMTDLKAGDSTMRIKVSAIPEDSQLIVPYTKDYARVPLSSGVILDEWTASQMGISIGDVVTIEGVGVPVTGTARNLVDRTEYISFETAEKMGHKVPDTVAVKTDAGADREKVLKEIADLPGYNYMISYDQQLISQEDSTSLVKISITSLQATAILMGMIIVFIMVALSITERKHEFAVLIALGVQDAKFAGMIIVENLVIFALAALIAFPVAWIGAVVMNSLMSRPGQVIEMYDFGRAYIIGVVLAFGYLAVGIITGIVKLYNLDAVAALSDE